VESRFDRWVESVYHRTKSRYHWVLIGATILSAHLLLAPMFVALLGPLWTSNIGEWPGILLIMEIATLAGIPSLFWVVMVHHRTLIRHLRGDPGVDPVTLWVTSVAELPKGVLQALAGYMVPLLVGNLYVGVRQDFGTVALVATSFGVVIMMLGAGSLIFLLWELGLRPVIREIAPHLPDDLVLRERGLSLGSKLLFLLVSLSLFSGMAVGAASSNPSLNHNTRLVVTIGTAILLSSTLAGAFVWMLEHSFVGRINELQRALQSFSGGGRRDIKLPPLAGDDLDQVGHAFNEMVQRINLHDNEMQASRARIVAVTDDERRRMERDLHDGAQQHLALLNLQLSVLERGARDHPGLAANVSEMRSTLAAALAEMRDLAHGIYPAALENDGLAAALAEAAARAALPTRLEVNDTGRTSRDIETAVYFCCLGATEREQACRRRGERDDHPRPAERIVDLHRGR
jgi:signal transduction histidine kinase